MSIFFFGKSTPNRILIESNEYQDVAGYDQGMMGGVNQSPDYINLMKFGYVDDAGIPVVTNTLLQGGIMAVFYLERSLAVCSAVTSVINTVESTLSAWVLPGAFL